ncbi:iron dicitrate transport regulator FecR [Pleurocapsa sp. CCALA 161]|uniref:FecR family protein n=1 Tax=Pleurocapsa sp. CCALA 161 TaxID=2107688 RepID=UPI000D053477|nr:FecR family protein [Pleurocapsa sp. CCALA 161]PSB07354.1 iron dicitrate transport regulator FecR [Pleurocapsa sp. CCALA 161]
MQQFFRDRVPYNWVKNLLLGLCLAAFLSVPTSADTVIKEAEIYKIRNQVDINYGQKQDWSQAQLGDVIVPQDSVRTGANSRADILFNEGTLVRTGAGTTFRFPPGKRSFELTSGAALIMIRPEQGQSTITTPEAKIVSQGTALFVQHNPKNSSSLVGVLTDSPAGLVKVQSTNGEVTIHLQAGQFVTIVQGVVGLVEHFVLPMFYETVELAASLGLEPEAREKLLAEESLEVQQTIRAVQAEAIAPLQNQLNWLRGFCQVQVKEENFDSLLEILGLNPAKVKADLSTSEQGLFLLPMRSLEGVIWLGKYCADHLPQNLKSTN